MLHKPFLDRTLYRRMRARATQYNSIGEYMKCKMYIIPEPHWLLFLHERIHIYIRILYNSIRILLRHRYIVLFKAKVVANSKVFTCLRSFQNQFQTTKKVWISILGFLNHVNRPTECNFLASWKWESEQSDASVPFFGIFLIQHSHKCPRSFDGPITL